MLNEGVNFNVVCNSERRLELILILVKWIMVILLLKKNLLLFKICYIFMYIKR